MAITKKVPSSGSSPKASSKASSSLTTDSAQSLLLPPTDSTIEFEQSGSLDKLGKALVKFRKTCKNPNRDREGYNYSYTTLDNIIASTQKGLADSGLALVQHPVRDHNGWLGCVSILLHESGQYLRCRFTMPIPSLSGTNVTQNAGAAITYARRYSAGAILFIASEDDTDGK